MNPDEQNNNPAMNPNPPADLGAATPPAADPIAMNDAAMGAAAPIETPVVDGLATDLGAPMTAAPAAEPAVMDGLATSAPVEPAAGPLADMGGAPVAMPADTTFTPVTAGEAAPPVMPAAPAEPAVAPGAAPASEPSVADAAAPANPANPAAAPMVGAPAPGGKFKLTKNTIILIAVAGVVLIGVIVLLIIANTGGKK